MQLLGSKTSPFVRRIRLLLGERDYQFDSLDIYNADRDTLRAHNPALMIPMLIDGEQSIFDSRVIARYLAEQFDHVPLDWQQENQLTVIDAANDSAVTLLLSQRSGLDTDSGTMFYDLQHERIRYALDWLDRQAAADAFDTWGYAAICLYCCYDWLLMRGLVAPGTYPKLDALLVTHGARPQVQATDPRAA